MGSVVGSKPGQDGFSLIELLVVLTIIGILTSLAALTVPDRRGEQLTTEARELISGMRAAGDESIGRNSETLVYFTEKGYGFRRYLPASRKYETMDEREMRFHEWPSGLLISGVVDGKPLEASIRIDANDSIAFHGSGESQAYRLSLKNETHAVIIASDGLSRPTISSGLQ